MFHFKQLKVALYCLQVSGYMPYTGVQNDQEDFKVNHGVHMVTGMCHYGTMAHLLPAYRLHPTQYQKSLHMCAKVATPPVGRSLLLRSHISYLLHHPLVAHIDVLRLHHLQSVEPERSGNCQHLSGHIPVKGQGFENACGSRHLVCFFLASFVGYQCKDVFWTKIDGKHIGV